MNKQNYLDGAIIFCVFAILISFLNVFIKLHSNTNWIYILLEYFCLYKSLKTK